MKIKWLGTATILIETEKVRIIFDPYLRELNKDRDIFPVNELNRIDAIFITHPHLDHFADINKVMEIDHAGKTPIYVCKRGIEIAQEQGFQTDRMKQVNPGDMITLGELKVTVFQGRHCIFDAQIMKETILRSLLPKHILQAMEIQKLNKKFHIGFNDIYGYEVEEDGKRVFIMGSANMPGMNTSEMNTFEMNMDEMIIKDRMDLDSATVSNPSNMDLLIYPYQGRSDMETYSLEFLKALKPKKVLLDHYDDAFPPISKQMNPNSFIDNVKQYFPEIPVIKTIEGQWYDI